MKILQISDGYKRIDSMESGPSVERVIFEVSKRLVNFGHKVTILERKMPGMKDSEEFCGVHVVRLDKSRANVLSLFNLNSPVELSRIVLDGLGFACSVKQYLRRVDGDFDVINFHLPLSGLPFTFLERKMRKRMVYTYHGNASRLGFSDRGQLPFFSNLLQPDLFLMKRVRKVVVLNNAVRETLISKCGLHPLQVIVIKNSVDSTAFNSKLTMEKAKEVIGFSGKIILFVGVLMPIKGVEYLIKAADILVNTYGHKDLLFLIVGSEDRVSHYTQSLKQLVSHYKLSNYFKFTGHVAYSSLSLLYSACDIFVLPSLDEGFGLVIAEAMSFGKPIVGTRVGGIPTQIKDGWNGFLVEPANAQQLAEKIRYLINNKAEREKMGSNSKQLAETEFTWEKVARAYESPYHSILVTNREA